jgi:hypothetical protein
MRLPLGAYVDHIYGISRGHNARQFLSAVSLTKEVSMPVSFAQMWKNFGLDVSAKPDPALIVPLGGDNVIKVFGAPDMSLFGDRGILEIKKLDSSALISERMVIHSRPWQWPRSLSMQGSCFNKR